MSDFPGESEAMLIQEHGAGLPDPITSFERFYRSDWPRLISFLWNLGADPEEAEDVAQTVMFEMFLRWNGIRSPKAYARRVAERVFLKCAVTLSRQRRSEEEFARGLAPVDPVVLTEEGQLVLTVLRSLPPKQRRVMAWHLDGFDAAEIARHTNQNYSTVRSNLRHARDALRPLYQRQRERRTSAGRRVDNGDEAE